jgi:hypothetical protein
VSSVPPCLVLPKIGISLCSNSCCGNPVTSPREAACHARQLNEHLGYGVGVTGDTAVKPHMQQHFLPQLRHGRMVNHSSMSGLLPTMLEASIPGMPSCAFIRVPNHTKFRSPETSKLAVHQVDSIGTTLATSPSGSLRQHVCCSRVSATAGEAVQRVPDLRLSLHMLLDQQLLNI